MSEKSIGKAVIVYTISLALSWILIEGTWGVTVGSLLGATIGKDQVLWQEYSKILKEKGINEADENWYEKLPPNVRKDIDSDFKHILKERALPNINWFGITLFVSAFIFAILGFFCGFIVRDFLFVGLIPALSFLINNPLVRFTQACNTLSLLQKAIIVIFAQFGICYLFGYLGTLLGKKRMKKGKGKEMKIIEPSPFFPLIEPSPFFLEPSPLFLRPLFSSFRPVMLSIASAPGVCARAVPQLRSCCRQSELFAL